MKMSNGKIERQAVMAVKAKANEPSSYLIANIPEGDKGISFDGSIDVFIDDSEKTESLLGSIPVQVKGTHVKKFSEGIRSYSLKLSHYQNFYNSSGAILLVVEINDNGASKIFYKQLLTKELSNIIQYFGHNKGQQTASVHLRPLDETTLYAICRKFLNEREYQPKILVERNPFNDISFSEYQFSSLTYNPNHAGTSNIFDHDFIAYGLIDKLKIPLHHARITELSKKVQDTIEVDGTAYLFNLKVIADEHQLTFVIEEVVQLTINYTTHRFNLTFLKFHSLAAQLKVIPFVLSVLSGHSICFWGNSIDFNSRATKEEMNAINKFYILFTDLQKAFELLGIDENRVISETEAHRNLYGGFQFLNRAILKNDITGFKIKDPEMPRLTNICIGDLVVVLFYDPESDNKLVNAFSEKLLTSQCTISHANEAPIPYSIYSMLEAKSLAEGANFDHRVICLSFDQIDPFYNDIAFDYSNNFCLNCLKSFDISKNTSLLDTAEHIYQKYPREGSLFAPTNNDAIVTINISQVRKRKSGQLTTTELEDLLIIKNYYSYEENIELHFCLNVLLESKLEAEMAFTKLSSERQGYYHSLPIYYLYEELLIL